VSRGWYFWEDSPGKTRIGFVHVPRSHQALRPVRRRHAVGARRARTRCRFGIGQLHARPGLGAGRDAHERRPANGP
jgi:hypothetical protein